MKKLLFAFVFIFLAAFVRNGYSRVLVVSDLDYWEYSGGSVLATYVSDARLYDYSIVDTMLFQYNYHISNMSNCQLLWNRLATAYDNSTRSGDTLEGVVLIGYEIPVPQAGEGEPFDFYYMDIWNASTQSNYANDGVPWPLDATDNNYLSGSYGSGGDGKYDVWVSRIWPGGIYFLRTATDLNYQDAYEITNQYLARVHDRHVSPAKVPSRGFAMGGIPNTLYNIPLSTVLGINRLELPMYSEFTYRKANPFRWMAQLQSGPYGSINNGAYYGTRFPDGPNTRPCTTAVIPDGYSTSGGTLNVFQDTLGWEWAGIYEHSCENSQSFDLENYDPHSKANGYLMGNFHNLTWGSQWQKTLSGGLDNAPYYFYDYNNPDYSPYGYYVKNKEATWRWRVEETGNYAVYLYNPSGNSINSNRISVEMNDNSVDANGYPIDFDINEYDAFIDQTSTNQWLTVFQPYSLLQGNSIMAKFSTNNSKPGRHIASAILFYNLDNGHPYYFDCNNVSDDQHNPDTLFAKTGFYTDDWVDRSFLDMQDESPTHDKISLTPFFITNACEINSILKGDWAGNLGNLYALGHSGLICLGTANDNYTFNNYDIFMDSLKAGKTFGKAFLDYMNTPFRYTCHYELLGAGTLKAQPYIQFGTQILENETINMWNSGTVYYPFLFRNLTFSGLGNVDVTTMTDENLSPKCSHADIVLRPETHLCTPSGNNYIDLKAQ